MLLLIFPIVVLYLRFTDVLPMICQFFVKCLQFLNSGIDFWYLPLIGAGFSTQYKVRVIPYKGPEWRYASCCILGLVIYELGQYKQLWLYYLLSINKAAKIIFQYLVGLLCLTVSLGIKCSQEIQLYLSQIIQLPPKLAGKNRATIQDNAYQGPKLQFDFVIEQFRQLIGSYLGRNQEKKVYLCELVHYNKNYINNFVMKNGLG